MLFENREHAARLLARRLSAHYKNKNPLVLAIPCGAIHMAEIIADTLRGELDIVLVHKLRAPGQQELAVGAIDEAGNVFLSGFALAIDEAYLEAEKQAQLDVLRKRRARCTPSRGAIDPHDRIVISAALDTAKETKKLVGAPSLWYRPGRLVQSLVRQTPLSVWRCPLKFYAVGEFFRDFSQVSMKMS